MATKRLQLLGDLQEVFIAEYGVTTFTEMEEAYNAGKLVFCRYNNNLIPMHECVPGKNMAFYKVSSTQIQNCYCTLVNGWRSQNNILSATKHEEIDGRLDGIEGQIGDIETALDTIIAIQNELIGGDGA